MADDRLTGRSIVAVKFWNGQIDEFTCDDGSRYFTNCEDSQGASWIERDEDPADSVPTLPAVVLELMDEWVMNHAEHCRDVHDEQLPHDGLCMWVLPPTLAAMDRDLLRKIMKDRGRTWDGRVAEEHKANG